VNLNRNFTQPENLNYIKYIYKILVIVGIVAIIVMLSYGWSEHNRAERLENNSDQKDGNSEQFMSKKEFKEFVQRDSARNAYFLANLDTLKIGIRKVRSTTTIKNNYINNDTTIYQTVRDINGLFPINVEQDCFSYHGSFDVRTGQYNHFWSEYNNEINVVEYWQRPKLFPNWMRLNWLKNPFKKSYYREQFSKCGETTYERIEISRKVD